MVESKTANPSRGGHIKIYKLLIVPVPFAFLHANSCSMENFVLWITTSAGNLNPRDEVVFLFLNMYLSSMYIAMKTKKRGGMSFTWQPL